MFNNNNSNNNKEKEEHYEDSSLLLKGSITVNYNNFSINGKSYKDWSDKEITDFWEGFDSNQLGNPDKYPFHELNDNARKDDWKKKLNIGNPETDDGHWVTLKNHQHVFIKNKRQEEIELPDKTIQ